MSININAISNQPYESKEQTQFNERRTAHASAMDAANADESRQYGNVLAVLKSFADMLALIDPADRPALGALVFAKASEQWASNKPMTAAIIQATADALGTTRDALLDELKEANQALPAPIQAERVRIAGA